MCEADDVKMSVPPNPTIAFEGLMLNTGVVGPAGGRAVRMVMLAVGL